MIQLPEIGTYAEVAAYLRLSIRTCYKMSCRRDFAHGIYLGRGRFNLARLKHCVEEKGTYLKDRKP